MPFIKVDWEISASERGTLLNALMAYAYSPDLIAGEKQNLSELIERVAKLPCGDPACAFCGDPSLRRDDEDE